MALQSEPHKKSAFNYERKQTMPTYQMPTGSIISNSLDSPLQSPPLSGTTPSGGTTPGGDALPFEQNALLRQQPSNQYYYKKKKSTFISPRVKVQQTMTVMYQTNHRTLISLSYNRGTVLLSDPLKRERITDARERSLGKLRNDNQILQQRLEELQFENRRLQIEKDQKDNQMQECVGEMNKIKQYINSLNNMLFTKMAGEQIYWYSNEPIFEIENNNIPNNNIGMNMNLDVIEYDKNNCDIIDEKQNDKNNQNEKQKFENYLEKIIRSARIFQDQYYNTLKQKQQAEKELFIRKTSTVSYNDTINELKSNMNELSTSKMREIQKLKVESENMKKDFENERVNIQKENENALKGKDEKMNDLKLQLQKKNKDIEYEKKRFGEVQINMQNIISEKRLLEIDYGKIKNTLDEREQHPILSNIKNVDNILLNYRNIQREFYNEIFDERANIHSMAFEYIRKEIKSKTAFQTRYCKQMALKILFETIHICWGRINKAFREIYNKIRMNLGIGNKNNKNNKLEQGLDFLLKYQFEEILLNILPRLRHNIIEEIYEMEFDLIQSHEGQNILIYNLHETVNPMERNQCVKNYISKICIICWKMIMFSHKNENKNKLMFYPMDFMETNNKNIKVNGEVYDKCTAHCEKKCDIVLFYVFPVIMKQRYANSKNIFDGIKLLNNEIDIDGNEIKREEDELEQETKIRIKVVTRKGIVSCFSKNYTQMASTNNENAEPMRKLGGIKLLSKPYKIAVICEMFKSIHQQAHKNLFEALQEYFDEELDSENENEEEEDEMDEEIIEMKIFKILFDILVSCYVRMNKIVNQISNENLSNTRLTHDKRYHLLLNLQHYYNELLSKENENEEKKSQQNDEREMVMKLINNIHSKYCKLYKFLETEQKGIKQLTKTYIMKCCECCFHFKSYSIMTENERKEEQNEIDELNDEYGLYPLCFVRDDRYCLDVMNKLKTKNLNNDIINFKKVRMGNHNELCMYNDVLHEKESTSVFENITNAKICYFTWPAIVTTHKNNEYIYGNVPTQCLTKIWVLLNDDVYHMIYSNDNKQE